MSWNSDPKTTVQVYAYENPVSREVEIGVLVSARATISEIVLAETDDAALEWEARRLINELHDRVHKVNTVEIVKQARRGSRL